MKSSERLLLSLFAVVLLGGGTLVMWDLYRERRDVMVGEAQAMELELVELEALLEDGDLWLERAAWLEENQPPYASREQIDNAIFEDARAPGVEGVSTSGIQLLDAVATPHYVQAGVTLTASGTVEAVFGWLHRLQDPASFRAVREIRVSPDPSDDNLILCEFELVRWYAPTPR